MNNDFFALCSAIISFSFLRRALQNLIWEANSSPWYFLRHFVCFFVKIAFGIDSNNELSRGFMVKKLMIMILIMRLGAV